MKQQKTEYSMYKDAGDGWVGRLVTVSASSDGGYPVRLVCTDGFIVKSKLYTSRGSGDPYDIFMWLASKKSIDLKDLSFLNDVPLDI